MSDEITKTITQKGIDAFNSVMKPISQRMSNPIIGSFAITWALINWKPITFFIFSNQSIEGKLDYIKTNFYQNDLLKCEIVNISNWIMYLIIPLAISCLYVWGAIRLENLIDTINSKPITKKYKNDFEKLKAELDDQATTAQKQAKVLEAKSHFKTIEQKEAEIFVLNNRIATVEKHASTQEIELDTIITERNSLQSNNFKLSEENQDLKARIEYINIVLPVYLKDTMDQLSYSKLNDLQIKLEKSFELHEEDSNNHRKPVYELIKNSLEASKTKPRKMKIHIEGHFNNETISLIKENMENLFLIQNVEYVDNAIIFHVMPIGIFQTNMEYQNILMDLPGVKKVRILE